MTELLPCPFCGGEARIIAKPYEPKFCVGCDDDTCLGFSGLGWLYETEEQAAAAWNRRAERTCRFKTNQEPEGGEVWSECGECGAQFGWDYWQCIESASYCPNCGGLIEVVHE